MSRDTHQPLQESDEKQLCVSCMAPNEPAAHFCEKCGAPLTSYASTGPFEQLLAEGAVYRQAAERPRSLIVVLGVWLIFGTMASGGVLLLVTSRDSSFMSAMVGGGMLAVSVAMIWKTTRNYLARPQVEDRSDA
jgi:hypothetical protein